MDIIASQITNMFPLFVLIALGYISGRVLKVKEYSLLSKILLFVFTPIIAFNAIVQTEISINFISLPIIFFTISSAVALFSQFLLSKVNLWNKELRNVFSYGSGSGNVAFYGVPAVLILLGEEHLPIILVAMIGYIVYDSTVGYLIISGEKIDVKLMIKKLITFPPFIAIVVGLVFQVIKVNPNTLEGYDLIVSNSQVTMATLGIFLIGLAVANLKVKMNLGYMSLSVLEKALLHPLLILMLIIFDANTFQALQGFEEVLMLIACVPIATNSVILATTYTTQEDQAALGVLTTAVVSLLSIPFWQYVLTLV